MFRLVILIALLVTLLVVYDSEKGSQSMVTAANHSLLVRERGLSTKKVDSAFFSKEVKIVALGDSLTSGYGDQSGNGGYVTILEQLLGNQRGISDISISNFAIGGLSSEQLIQELDKKSIQDEIAKVDYILITIGGNDVIAVAQENIFTLSKEPFEEENKNFTRKINILVHKLRFYNPNATLFFVGIYNPFSTLFASVPEIDQIIENWNEGTENVLTKYENTYFIPISDVFKGNEEEYLYDDYIHPNEEGYKHLANRVLTYIDQYSQQSVYVDGETDEGDY
ncbi:GDSL-type esterase/lipase family protein [Bacillus sp. DJP31]|uniref:GDSL-type esterase/lipase family protein n=1 Tax=Bacillus sp. DJP31 TaxID=3409789 RepID=UPI003BB701E1